MNKEMPKKAENIGKSLKSFFPVTIYHFSFINFQLYIIIFIGNKFFT